MCHDIKKVGNHWFKSYLQDRKQCCKVNGHTSGKANVNCSVPQGSCLGPLLFLMYINDLPCALQSTKVTMYAEDTSISFSSKSIAEINEAVNSDLKRLQTWLIGNKLSLNVAKMQSMILGSSINLKNIILTMEILRLISIETRTTSLELDQIST